MLTDNQEVPIGWSNPISGNHHDNFELRKTAREIFNKIEEIGISLNSIFLNADVGFDVKDFRKLCEEKEIIHDIDFNKRRGKR